ncbi:MAG: S8 family serine peptidase, partial [Sphingomonadales bacterium]
MNGINALPAYDDGLSGQGVTVAVVDTGIDIDNIDLIANIDARSTNIATGNFTDRNDIDGHGTEVAGIIAAMRNSVGTHGVAFNASILSLRTDDPGSCADECEFFDHVIADAVDF